MTNILKKTTTWAFAIGTSLIASVIYDWVVKPTVYPFIFKWIKIIFYSVVNFFAQKIALSLWAIILLILGLVYVILLFVAASARRRTRSNSVSSLPYYLDYTSDIFDGVLYKWAYFKDGRFPYGNKYCPHSFEIYCPKDNCKLVNHVCPICHKPYGFIKPTNELEALVMHKIDNNLVPK